MDVGQGSFDVDHTIRPQPDSETMGPVGIGGARSRFVTSDKVSSWLSGLASGHSVASVSAAIVGVPCQENIDCQTTNGGAFCDSTKRCDCLPAYVNINGYCWASKLHTSSKLDL